MATASILFAVACGLDLLAIHGLAVTPSVQVLASFLTILCIAGAPFVVVLLHFRWQRPTASNVPLALATGLLSFMVAAFLVATLGVALHVRLGGGL